MPRVAMLYTGRMNANMLRRTITLAALCSGLIVAACEDKTPAPKLPTSAPKPVAPAPKPAAPTPQANPAPTTPTAPANPTAPAPAAPGGAAATSVTVGQFDFPLPAGWRSVPPANQMRLAEVLVADPSGDAAKASSIVFSSAGGDVQANIDRWAGQVRDDAGQPGKPKVEKKTVAGLPVSIVEITGAYSGMGEPAPHANWMLRGAIIEDPAGTLFIKMTGPAEPMAAAAPGFATMIDGLKKH